MFVVELEGIGFGGVVDDRGWRWCWGWNRVWGDVAPADDAGGRVAAGAHTVSERWRGGEGRWEHAGVVHHARRDAGADEHVDAGLLRHPVGDSGRDDEPPECECDAQAAAAGDDHSVRGSGPAVVHCGLLDRQGEFTSVHRRWQGGEWRGGVADCRSRKAICAGAQGGVSARERDRGGVGVGGHRVLRRKHLGGDGGGAERGVLRGHARETRVCRPVDA